jgi:hypothetical protein
MYADVFVLIERKEAFLLIETKHREEEMAAGQRFLLEAFSRKRGCVAAIVWGEESQPERYQFCKRGVWYQEKRTDRNRFRGVVAKWFKSANTGDLLFWEKAS